MRSRNIWVVTGALGVMALGIGAAVGASSQNTTELGSALNGSVVNQTKDDDDGALRNQGTAPLELPASANPAPVTPAADTADRTAVPTPAVSAVTARSAVTAGSAHPAPKPSAPPAVSPVPVPAPVQDDSDWTAPSVPSAAPAPVPLPAPLLAPASAPSAASAFTAASGD